MQIDRNNKIYVEQLRWRAEQYIDDVAINHLKAGGAFDAKIAAKTLMGCIEWARLATDMLAANGLLPPPEEPKQTIQVKKEEKDEVSNLGS